MGRPREQNISKDGYWKRAQRAGTKASKCSKCGRPTSGRGGIQHHTQGVLNNEHSRVTLCRSCHAKVDNPMKSAIKGKLS